MAGALINFSLKNKLLILLMTLAMMAWGVYNFFNLPLDAVPDITNNQVQVITSAPSLSPQEVEQLITYPVEIAMANIQDVTEIRSVSRYGLSVVTIVFHDKTDPYLARQIVNEQIQIAMEDIPEGYGHPQMMPVTTGLGEIYQYVLDVDSAYKGVYDAMELRTIQDWIVKRNLAGIPGIVEVSSFGGFLKQYEISIVPRRLVDMNISLIDIFDALERNNQNSGGSYIEKGPEAFYIRAEGMIRNAEDIKSIQVKNTNGLPVLIGDIAEVNIGHPPRFGAMTRNGEGEAVGGITLMLKGANSAQTLARVKERVTEVEKMLPKGIHIHPYLDRSSLISKTIQTVSRNLIEGGLIVLFILVLLLGNFRAGLIVASVIPLSMLFAFSMMNLFGVSANLMSLGAIDFGLIVDGSVIVVEGIVHRLQSRYKGSYISREKMSENILLAGKSVGKSAIFGVLIILIVYIPILTFTGIEGKMFKPMAQTVSFALLGALLLSLTYVPVMSAIALKQKISSSTAISDRIIAFLNKMHQPVLQLALKFKVTLSVITLLIVAISFYAFSKMGGEFIPTLEEGDLAVQMTLSPGSSLKQSIATSSEVEKILLHNFPEVIEVVSKIGTAEVPTDPMAIEDADIMIIMKPKTEWTSATNREDLVDQMKEKLSVIPGAAFEFQQPIQLRFNELMTGVKADVAVKIYGEDLNTLFKNASDAASVIQKVEGAGDVRVEQILGLPQFVVRYKRDQLALYGLNINDVNKIIRTAYAGLSAGVVFESERRFDLVVRLCEDCRNQLKSLRNLRVNRSGGELITLEQVADISFEEGPMQISRDDTKRRITIGVNVRNRDVESFVNEIQEQLAQNISLPPGYYFTYGGQFENLEAAKKNSAIAVPIALIAIFLILYFTFHSLKEALMVFTAIPLAAVGGIWALYLRDMPFSISAGVGFIALFGVAVLNGIVLISYYNQLEKDGVKDILQRVIEGTKLRLRPVTMTAAVAALGFIPMALSSAPGAEVQKPLATVVIGGLVTSTFLTLVLLPVIYVLFNRVKIRPGKAVLLLLPFFVFAQAQAQSGQDEVLQMLIQQTNTNNPNIKNAYLSIDEAKNQRKTAINLPRPEITYETGQINSSLTDYAIRIKQSFDFPSVYAARAKALNFSKEIAGFSYVSAHNQIIRELLLVYNEYRFLQTQTLIMERFDSLAKLTAGAAKKSLEAGLLARLDYLTAVSSSGMIHTAYLDLLGKKSETLTRLKNIVFSDSLPEDLFHKTSIQAMHLLDSARINSPLIQISQLETQKNLALLKEAKWSLMPGFSVGYFTQSLDKTTGFSGWEFGISLPVWAWSEVATKNVAKIRLQQSENNAFMIKRELESRRSQLLEQKQIIEQRLSFYEKDVLPTTRMIFETASRILDGETGYIQAFVQQTKQALELENEYYATVRDYNKLIIEIGLLSINKQLGYVSE